MLEATVVASEIFNVFGLQQTVKAGVQCGRAFLGHLECKIYKRSLIGFVLVVAKLAFDLRFQFSLQRKSSLTVNLSQFVINDGRKPIGRPIINPHFDRRAVWTVRALGLRLCTHRA
jgi:hypothetical protein